MRLLCLLLAAWLMAGWHARADERLLTRFDGHTTLTTADFTVPDGWEIRWHSEQVLSLGVIRRDNTVIAGTTGHGVGSLYLPQGGTFRIRVKGNDPIPWDVAIYVLDPDASPDDADDHFYVPTPGPAFKPEVTATDTGLPPASPDDTTAAAGASTNDTSAPATPPAPPPLPTQLSGDQVRALVQIKGDRAAGTGFFAKLGKDKFIVTTQQLIADNPNWKVSTLAGNPVEVTKIEGARDRDVALLSVKDYDFPALEVGNADNVQAGDMVLTGNEDNPVIPSTDVIAVSPQRIEIDQLAASPGSPVVLARTGEVLGVVISAPEVTSASNFATGNFDHRDQAATSSVASYALRLDDIPAREAYDPLRLQVQTQFLDAVHQHSRALDAYLNGGSAADQRLWQGDDKVKAANDTFLQNSAGGDTGARNDALRTLIFELGLAADTDMDQVQLPSNFYGYPGLRAKDESLYRRALKGELDNFGGNLHSLNTVVNRDNN